MEERDKKLIAKYGSDLFLFIRRSSLNGIVWDHPAYSDVDWARILKNSSRATRKRVFSYLPEVRKNDIAKLIETVTEFPCSEIEERLAAILKYYGSYACFLPENSSDDFDVFYAPEKNQKYIWAVEPYNLFIADPEETIGRWMMMLNVSMENVGVVFKALFDAEMDAYSRKMFVRCMQWPNSCEFNVQDLRESFLIEVEDILEGMSEIIIGMCEGKRAEEVRGTVALKFGLDSGELHGGAVVPSSIVEGPQSVESANSMLGMMDEAIQSGILSIEYYLPEIQSEFVREGLQHVTDGFEPEYLDMWLKARRKLFIQDAERSFDVSETGCRIILGGCSSRMGIEIMKAHTFEDISPTRETGLLTQHIENTKENKSQKSAKVADSWSDTGKDISTPLGWFIFKISLDELLRSNSEIIKKLPVVAELAAIIPPERWEDLGLQLSGPQRIQAFQLGLDVLLSADRFECGAHILNLILNLHPDFDKLSENYAEYKNVFHELTDLNYWDAMLMEPDDFSNLIDGLRPFDVTGLAASSWGRFAESLDMPLPAYEESLCSWSQARNSLLSGFADYVLSRAGFKPANFADHSRESSIVEAIKPLVDKYADLFVKGIVTDNLDDRAVSGLAISNLPAENFDDLMLVFDSLHENTILHILIGLESNTGLFEHVCSILYLLDQKKRTALQDELAKSGNPNAAVFINALSFGFEQVVELSDNQIRELLKYVSNDDLCSALMDAPDELVERFMSSMSQRAANMIREDMDICSHRCSSMDILKARKSLVELIREYELLPENNERESNENIVRRIISMASKSEGEEDLF